MARRMQKTVHCPGTKRGCEGWGVGRGLALSAARTTPTHKVALELSPPYDGDRSQGAIEVKTSKESQPTVVPAPFVPPTLSYGTSHSVP